MAGHRPRTSSPSALGRAVAHAAEAGVDVDWQCHDLSRTFPDGSFDLVSAQYLHTPVEVDGERSAILRRAAAAVAPGGVLLVIGHEKHERHPEADLPTTGEVLAGLDLDPVAWRVELADVVERAVLDPGTGARARARSRRDVLRVRRGRGPLASSALAGGPGSALLASRAARGCSPRCRSPRAARRA